MDRNHDAFRDLGLESGRSNPHTLGWGFPLPAPLPPGSGRYAEPAAGPQRAEPPLLPLVGYGGREDPEPQGRGGPRPGGAGGQHQRGPGAAGRAEDQLGA